MPALLEEKAVAQTGYTKPAKKKAKSGPSRQMTHLVMVVTTVLACGLAALYRPAADISEMISIGTGYYALLLMAITLLIGPYKLLRQRKNPVNIDLRRDIGIWAGINTLIHVFFSFQLFQKGQVLLYFLLEGGGLRTDMFGAGNDFGMIAFLLMLPVLFTSNQISLKLLKGKRWKGLQRWTYLAFAFGVIHTVAFQFYNIREGWFSAATAIATLGVLVAQSIGIALTVMRERKRQAANISLSPVPGMVAKPVLVEEVKPDMARRRFLKIAAGALVTSAAAGTVAYLAVSSQEQTATGAVAENPVTAGAATATPVPSTTSASTTSVATSTSAAVATTASPTTTAAATTTTASTTSATTAAAANATVLATTASLGVGKAMFFTSSSGQRMALVHRKDGSVGCFSGVCTHEPVNLTFNETRQTLYCAKHQVDFDITNGNPSSMPARTALKKYTVTVDGSGNITYTTV